MPLATKPSITYPKLAPRNDDLEQVAAAKIDSRALAEPLQVGAFHFFSRAGQDGEGEA